MTFFKKVITSVKDFEKYPELATQPIGSTFKYFMLLIAILTIVISGIFIFQIYNFLQYIENDLPNFEFANNTLQMEIDEPINIENNAMFFKTFIVDTNDIEDVQLKLYKSQISNSMTGIAFLKDRVLISVSSDMEPIEYSYSNLFDNLEQKSLSKKEIVRDLSKDEVFYTMTIFFIIFFAYGFMYYLTETLVLALIITLLGQITSMIVRIRLKISAIFNMALYSFTLPIILLLIYSIIHMFTGFEIIYFDIMYFGISCIYIITAILIIKSDLIKRQQELTKIIEEQARIAEWQKNEKQNEEKRKEEEQKEKQKQDGDKEKQPNEDEKKEKNDGQNDNKEDGIGKKQEKKKQENKDGGGLEPQGNMFKNEKGIQER